MASLDDVIVCENEPFLIDDHAGTQAALSLRALVGGIEETIEKILEGILATAARTLRLLFTVDNLSGGNIDDRRLVTAMMAAKEFDIDTGLGNSSGVAPLAAGACVAFTCPEITVPIRMPIDSVTITSTVAMNLRFQAQLAISRN